MKIKLFTNSGNFERNIVLEGFDMTGHLTLSRNPMTAHEAATKRYVDNFPYNLSVENIVGGPVLVERLAQGIDGDITMYNSSQTVLKAVVASGSYSQVTVNSKGQIVAGVAPSNDNAVPTLQFTEVKQKPTTLSGYVADASGYICNTSDAVNQPLTGSLTLSRTPHHRHRSGQLRLLDQSNRNDGQGCADWGVGYQTQYLHTPYLPTC